MMGSRFLLQISACVLQYLVVSAVTAGREHLGVSEIGNCTFGIIGAGWSGVYWAWRLGVDAKIVPSDHICIFEAYGRIGGRTYTIHEEGEGGGTAAVDVGAYRFAGDMYLPADLIMHALKLPTSCYEPTCKDAEDLPYWPYRKAQRKVVDDNGLNAGYDTPIHVMMGQFLASGGRFFRGYRLTDLDVMQPGGGVALRFSNRIAAKVPHVLLNLPRPSLLQIRGFQKVVSARVYQILQCDSSSGLPFPHLAGSKHTGGVKAYAYYQDAWWLTKLNLSQGSLKSEDKYPPLAIRYHDGPVECDGGQDVGGNTLWVPPVLGAACRGALEVVYDFSHVDWWMQLQQRPEDALTLLRNATILHQVHQRLMDLHRDNLTKAGVMPESLRLPQWIALGTWSVSKTSLQPGPAKVVYKGGDAGLANACGVEGLTGHEYAEQVISPRFPEILLANNDFHAQTAETWDGDWAQDTLLLAERGLRRLNVSAPSWLNHSYYQQRITEMGVGAMTNEPVHIVV